MGCMHLLLFAKRQELLLSEFYKLIVFRITVKMSEKRIFLTDRPYRELAIEQVFSNNFTMYFLTSSRILRKFQKN